MIPASLGTVIPYVAGYAAFVLTDSVEAAITTAIIAGVFSLINTILNGTIFRRVHRTEQKLNRALEIVGERSSDKSSTDIGRKNISETPSQDRRKS